MAYINGMSRPVMIFAFLVASTAVFAQDRLPLMPGYASYQADLKDREGTVKGGTISDIRWDDKTSSLFYQADGKKWKVDLKNSIKSEISEFPPEATASSSGRPTRGVERGRQFDSTTSADGKLKAFHRDRNVFLANADGTNEKQITTGGSVANRIKFGIASWVYGEELGVRDALWFSPDGKKLAFYRFDESKVKDYHLALGQTQLQTRLDVEAYPKAGTDNPGVDLWLYDVESGKTAPVDVRFQNADLGHYVYEVRWSPDGKELLFNRTNRLQNTMQFCAANPDTGACRVVVTETWAQSWTENAPPIWWFADGKRFIWTSERSGFRNLYLGSVDGSPLKPITTHSFDVINLVKVVEKEEAVYYMARSGDNPYLAQYHRVRLDGKFEERLTDADKHHSITPSPFGHWFIDRLERRDSPPATVLKNRKGLILFRLSDPDMSEFEKRRFRKIETFTFPAADGKTQLYGQLHFPRDFDPKKKYPLIVETYAGPDSGGSFERWEMPDTKTGFGVLVAAFEGRGTNGRGKAFRDAVYGKLGVVEIDDQAAGVKFLRTRAYVDGTKVGITGTSYGGYATVMAMLRHPDVFQVGVAASSVTTWLHYDTIYTERYMGTPQTNPAGYEAASAMKYARDLKGRLLLFYGTSDNNVHPANTLMLTNALDRAGKSYSMYVGADQGHAGVGFARTMEFFLDGFGLSK
jgi:dipeptidyl-peptidase 4